MRRQVRLIQKADTRNAKYRRNSRGGSDPRRNVPKKRTRFPGQSLFCGICGRLFVFGGHGQRDHLECSDCREYRCWNATTVDGPLAARKISEAVLAQIEQLEDFYPAFLELVNEGARNLALVRDSRLRQLAVELEEVEGEIANLLRFIRSAGDSPSVRDELRRLEQEKARIEDERSQAEQMPRHAIVVPPIHELKLLAREALGDLAVDSFEFARRMRELTGPTFVDPYQACGGGHVVLRARFRLTLANLLPESGSARCSSVP